MPASHTSPQVPSPSSARCGSWHPSDAKRRPGQIGAARGRPPGTDWRRRYVRRDRTLDAIILSLADLHACAVAYVTRTRWPSPLLLSHRLTPIDIDSPMHHHRVQAVPDTRAMIKWRAVLGGRSHLFTRRNEATGNQQRLLDLGTYVYMMLVFQQIQPTHLANCRVP
jgi:hypothetical protein